jgi:triosephosphate isomerase
MAQRPYIVGNWKMHGTRAMLSEARAIDRAAERLLKAEVALAPPFTLIHATRKEAGLIGVGAQDCHAAEGGAHTGDISAAMLKDAGAGFVIVGPVEASRRSRRERRRLSGPSAEARSRSGLSVIVCVGETEAHRVRARPWRSSPRSSKARAARRGAAESQRGVRAGVGRSAPGATPTVEDVGAMHSVDPGEALLVYGEGGAQVRILYGGSVKPDNAAELLERTSRRRARGGASLTAESFLGIIVAAAEFSDG